MPRRLASLWLLVVFLGAGTTLPGPDALLYHWDTAGDLRSHIEPAGGCASHAEHCTLGRTATGAGASLTSGSVVRVQPAGVTSPAFAADAELVPDASPTLPPSRAPPAPVV